MVLLWDCGCDSQEWLPPGKGRDAVKPWQCVRSACCPLSQRNVLGSLLFHLQEPPWGSLLCRPLGQILRKPVPGVYSERCFSHISIPGNLVILSSSWNICMIPILFGFFLLHYFLKAHLKKAQHFPPINWIMWNPPAHSVSLEPLCMLVNYCLPIMLHPTDLSLTSRDVGLVN